MRQLDFKTNRVETLTLDELSQSYQENCVTGEPVGGIYHFALIGEVLKAFEGAGLKPDVMEIFAANNRDSRRPGVTVLPQLEEKYGERAVQAHLLRRVYANIAIRADEDGDTVTNVAVAYHQKGIQVGIGPMVKVCHNQTILGASDVVANYACYEGGRIDAAQRTVQAVLDKVTAWAAGYEEDQKTRKMAEVEMRNTDFTRRMMYITLGVLMEKRVRHDSELPSLHDNSPYPLNASQINNSAEELLDIMETSGAGDRISAWEAYNSLNTVLKPDRMDIPQVLPQSLALITTLTDVIHGRYE